MDFRGARRITVKDALKAVEAAILRLHRWFFDDEEWGREEYVDTYGPFALFIAYEVLILVIAGILN